MTLILSCATREYVVQVADRRLTWPDGRQKDNATKVVFYNGRIAFGYTGRAYVGSREKLEETTAWWLTDVLTASSQRPLKDTLEYLQEQATEKFRRLRCPTDNKCLTVVGIGWGTLHSEPSLIPLLCMVTNCQNAQGEVFSPRDTFQIFCRFLRNDDPHQFLFWPAGRSLPEADHRRLRQEIERRARRPRPVSPLTLTHLLALGVRRVAAHDKAVGHSLLAVSIPRQAVMSFRQTGIFQMIRATPAMPRKVPSFLYIPAGSSDGTAYAPYIANRGVSMYETSVTPL